MSNAIIKQGDNSLVADNYWDFRVSALPFVAGLVLGAAGALALGAGRERGAGPLPRPPVPLDWPVNFAHRGGAGIGPENTVEGFTIGLEAGAGVIELDVQTTVDDVLVVHHDPDTRNTAGGRTVIAETTFERLRELDFAAEFVSKKTGQPWDGPPCRIPTLAEVFTTFPDHKINIEIKGERQGTVEALWQVITEHDAQDRVLVSSTKADQITLFRKLSGGTIPTGASTPEFLGFWLRHVFRLRQPEVAFQAFQGPKRWKNILPVVTGRFTRNAHAAGLRVDVWTIDVPAVMGKMLDIGVDGVITDRPDLLTEVLASRP